MLDINSYFYKGNLKIELQALVMDGLEGWEKKGLDLCN